MMAKSVWASAFHPTRRACGPSFWAACLTLLARAALPISAQTPSTGISLTVTPDTVVEGNDATVLVAIGDSRTEDVSVYVLVEPVGRTALGELMPGSVRSVTKDGLYRVSDQLYEHRVAIETELAARERELFALDETIILYDLSSTYFEGIAAGNEKAEHGYSRDHRGDCKQVVIGLVLDGEGFPKAHEVFTGNTKDENSLAGMLDSLDCRTAGAAGWPSQPTVIMDRGLATDDNLKLLRKRGHHYIVTTSQSERRELFPEIDRARYVPVKVNAKGKVVVSGQLRRHQGEVYVLSATAPRGRARIARYGSGSSSGWNRMPTSSR